MIVASLFFYILNYGLQLALAMLMLMKEIPENIMDYVSVGIMILRCVLLTCIIILLKRYISKHVEVLDKIFSRIIGWMTLIWLYGDNCWNYALCIRKIRLFNERSNAGKYHSVFTDITDYACISGFCKD